MRPVWHCGWRRIIPLSGSAGTPAAVRPDRPPLLAVAVLALAATTIIAPPAVAQESKRPATWKVQLDAGHGQVPLDSLSYETMSPGWHVTTRRYSGIYYDPAWQASGDFRIVATIFVFPDSRAEGFGIFFGGAELEQDTQRYTYVLLRKDGRYLVKQRRGEATRDLVPWTEHAAVARPTADANAKNVMVVEARGASVAVLVNDQLVVTLPRRDVENGGQAGLRLNHGLNLHVSEFRIEALR